MCKKDGRKKTLSIIALAICGLWFILAGLNSAFSKDSSITSSIEDTNSSTSIDSAQNSPEDLLSTEESTVPEELAEEPKDTTTDNSSVNKFYPGDTWENKYVSVSFNECGEYISDNQFIQPSSGNKYIYATFTFENVGSSDTTVAYWDFDCYADGYACDGIYEADDSAFSQTLSSGRKITGSVYFEVPENASEIELEFSPSFWTSEKIVFVYSN